MTVAVLVKVYDGLALCADSATTMGLSNGSAQVYNHATKIFHLHRKLPVGAMTWGLGSVGPASVSTVAKELRARLMGKDPAHPDWVLEPETYSVQGVAERAADLFHTELTSASKETPPPGSGLGLLVAGYSSGSPQAEAWLINIDPGAAPQAPLRAAGPDEFGWVSYAQAEATMRLFYGFDPSLPAYLASKGGATENEWCDDLRTRFAREAVPPAMPFPDAVKFGRFLVDTTVGYSRYLLGPDTVGGEVEVAGITRHEGFKWVSRKHWYPANLNPEDPNHA